MKPNAANDQRREVLDGRTKVFPDVADIEFLAGFPNTPQPKGYLVKPL
jgi:hypothetical protein